MARMLAVAGVVAALAVTSAQAGLDVDFGANVRIDDRTDLFFRISSHYFDRDRAVVDHWGTRIADPDDLAVFLFLSRHGGSSPDEVWAMRRGGMSWWEIGVRVGVPAERWFVPVRRDPGPPYGRAYGHYKKHRHDPARIAVTDAEARNLVAVRVLHDYYGVPVETAMGWRAAGRDVRALATDEYARRHGHGEDKGKGHGHGKGNGKGKRK